MSLKGLKIFSEDSAMAVMYDGLYYLAKIDFLTS
jgi:hypothetical protein